MKKNNKKMIMTLCVSLVAFCIILIVSSEKGNEKTEDGTKNDITEKENTETDSDNENSGGDNMKEIFNNIRAMKAGEIVDVSTFSEELIDSLFFKEEIGEELKAGIMGISYKENDNIALSDLNYIRVLHIGFDGQVHIGELIVNKAIADDIISIMHKLYDNEYPIEKMVLVDEYGGDDEASMADNNTSAFNYRVIANTTTLSNHALGMAIDINPRYNPYVTVSSAGNINIAPANGAEYADRNKEFFSKIDREDLCYRLFLEHGFSWGGDWSPNKDYQHFEKTAP